MFFITGAESMFTYDPASFGTPLALLQIPPQAIREVTSKLGDAACTSAAYTQDCRPFSDLKSLVSGSNMAVVTETSVDVGYICKKCHMVYPAREACINHQRMLCFAGKASSDTARAILKLEQTQYECKLCAEHFSTLNDVKQHCDTDLHTTKMATIGLPPSSGSLTVTSSSPSSSSTTTATAALSSSTTPASSVAIKHELETAVH